MNIAVQTAVMAATMHNSNSVAADLPPGPMPVWALLIVVMMLVAFAGFVSWIFYQLWKLK